MAEPPRSIWSLIEDSTGHVWLPSYEFGLYRVSPSGELRHWTRQNGLSHETLRTVFEDREGNLWCGGRGGGLQRLTPRDFRGFGPAAGLAVPNTRSVAAASEGGIWAATLGCGLFRLDGKSVVPVPFPSDAPAIWIQSVYSDSADRARVELRHAEGEVTLTIADNGSGFDPAAPSEKGSLGLVSMKERVRLVRGTLAIVSAPGDGTRIAVRVPAA